MRLFISELVAFLILLCAFSPDVLAKGDAKNGALLFEKNQCKGCHVNGTNLIDPDKPLKGSKFLAKYPKDEPLAAVIRKGIPGTAMPSSPKDMLPDNELADIIAYIRSLTAASVVPPKNVSGGAPARPAQPVCPGNSKAPVVKPKSGPSMKKVPAAKP